MKRCGLKSEPPCFGAAVSSQTCVTRTMTSLVLLLPCSWPTRTPRVTLERLGRLDHPPIREASGIVKSRRAPGDLLGPQRLGQPPRPVRRPARRVARPRVSVDAPNVDWEDIAADDRGHLYLGDIGNNDGRLPLRAVYQIDEPDPSVERRDGAQGQRPPAITGSRPAAGSTPRGWSSRAAGP